MTLAYILLVSMFCSHSMSYENGLQLWKDCPSMQSTTMYMTKIKLGITANDDNLGRIGVECLKYSLKFKVTIDLIYKQNPDGMYLAVFIIQDNILSRFSQGSHGSHFEITNETFNNACKNLLSELDTEKPSRSPRGRTDLDVQFTSNKDRVNITWNVKYENRCHRRIFMLDVEYRIENSRGNGTYVDHYCFQYNLSKGEPERKETVTFYFDCIRTVPDRVAYLTDITLWSLLPNYCASSRNRRSAKSHCSRIRCTRSLKVPLKIGPIPPNKIDDEIKQWCQCWANSRINLEETTDTKDRCFKIVVANPNPYAVFITIKVYKEDNEIFPVFSKSLGFSAPAEVKEFLTNISCENGEGTYTPELRYQCDDSGHSTNSECQPQYIDGSSIICPVKTPAPPSNNIHHIAIILPVLAGVIATVAVTVIVFRCKHAGVAMYSACMITKQMNKPAFTTADNRLHSHSTSEETETINPEGNDSRPTVNSEEEVQNLSCESRQIMLLYHTDFTTTPVRKDCVKLLTELLQAVGIKVLGFDRAQFFLNWIELAERASKDDITEFLIIISRELVSFHNSYMTSFNSSKAVCTELQNNKEYFSCAVLKTLRDRYFLQERAPFNIHILSLEHSDSQICEKYINTYSSFMISGYCSNHRKNTFSYCFAKCSEDTKSFIFDETVLPSLLKRLNGTTTLPTKTSVSKLKEKLAELFENPTPSTVGERTDNCEGEDLERTKYSSETNVQLRYSFSKPNYRDRRVQLPFVRSGYSTCITKCSQSRRKRSDSGDEIEMQML